MDADRTTKKIVGIPWACALVAVALPLLLGADPLPQSSSRDLQLTLHARQAVFTEPVLSGLKIGVNVRRQVATLYGTVPSADLARRAEECVRRVPGLKGIQNGLRIEPVESPHGRQQPGEPAPPPGWRPGEGQASKAAPSLQMATIHDSLTPPSTLAILGRASGARGKPTGESLTVMPVITLPGATVARGLEEKIGSLSRRDPRYRLIQFEIHDRTVYLSSTGQHSAPLYMFAREIAVLPGVERVILTPR